MPYKELLLEIFKMSC